MKQGKKIVAVVPARFGSERVRCKALRLLAGKPLIYYVLTALKQCTSFNEVYVNSESEVIGEVAQRFSQLALEVSSEVGHRNGDRTGTTERIEAPPPHPRSPLSPVSHHRH